MELQLKVSQFWNSPQLLRAWFRPGGGKEAGASSSNLISFICDSNHITHVHTQQEVSPSQMFVTVWTFQFKFVPFQPPAQNKSYSSTRNPGHGAGAAGWRITWCHGCAASFPVDKTREWILHKARESCQSSTSLQPQQEVRNLRRHV